jgi:hypothetical protein
MVVKKGALLTKKKVSRESHVFVCSQNLRRHRHVVGDAHSGGLAGRLAYEDGDAGTVDLHCLINVFCCDGAVDNEVALNDCLEVLDARVPDWLGNLELPLLAWDSDLTVDTMVSSRLLVSW